MMRKISRIWVLAISLFLLSIVLLCIFRDYRGRKHPFISDVDQYYSYLPALFIHHDLGFHFPNEYWLIEAPNGGRVPKVSMGMAMLYTPWFLMAEGINKAVRINDKGGYSSTHTRMCELGSIIYLVIAFILLHKTLLLYFERKVSLITIFTILLGSNLFYYSYGWPVMTHLYEFFLFSVVIYSTVKWFHQENKWHLYLLAFSLGLIIVSRPADGIICLFPLLYGITNKKTIKDRVLFFMQRPMQLLLALLLLLIPIIPQLIFWKIYAGQWLFFSYGNDERFFFDNPQWMNFLFSYRKGWLLYTPVMILALTGLLVMKKKLMDFRLAIYVIIGTAVYMLSSWWAWWYGGSFGNRSMIQYYALLAFPLAACIDIALSELKRKALVFCFILACIGVNIFQVWQYEKPLIHWDSMTKEAYHAIFLSTHYPENYENLLWEPDYIGMKRNGMENGLPIDRMIYPTEELIKKDQEFSKAHEFRIAKLIEAETMTLRTHVSIYSDIVISDSLFLMSSIQTGDSLKTYPCLKITINEKELHQWKEFVFNQKVPQGPYTSKDTLKLFLWNKGKHTYRIRKFSVCNHA